MKTGKHSVGVAESHRGMPRQKHTARNVIIIVLVIIVAIALCGVSLYMSARSALSDARTLQGQIGTLETQVSDDQITDARATAQQMGTAAADLHEKMSNPLWRIASVVPVYGSDVKEVMSLASVADDLTNNALVPVLQNVQTLDVSSFVKKNGDLDVDKIVPAVQALGSAAPVIQRSNNTVSSMGTSNFEQINTSVTTLKALLPGLVSVSRVADQLSPVIGDVLGADGSRTYLLVAQNNVEMRSVGGFPGSMGPLTIKNGKVKLGDFKSVYDYMPRLDGHPVSEVSTEEHDIFSKRMGYIPGDVGQIVDFERVASIWNAQWNASNSSKIDGIIAVDPVFLQDLLKLTGGITASNGWKVNGKNAAQVLMNKSYTDMPVEQTDDFFSAVAEKSFKKIRSSLGKLDITKLAETVNDGADEGRLRVWMKNSDEESAMRALGYTGELSDDMTKPVLGVYISDYAWSKIGWYLEREVSVGSPVKNADGTSTYDVTVTLRNSMTKAQYDEAAKAGTYIYGQNPVKRSNDDMVYFLYLTAPAGGTISNVKTSGYFGTYSKVNHSDPLDGKSHDKTMAEATYNGIDIWGGETQIKRGKTTTVSFQVTVTGGTQEDLKVGGTPSANPGVTWTTKYK